MKAFFSSLYEGTARIKKYLSNYMTGSEQKMLFFMLFVLLLGTVLTLFGYTAPEKANRRIMASDRDSLQVLISTDFYMRYDINRVTYDELLYITGIGPATATAIIAYQQSTGFSTIDDLLNIRGIGAARLNAFREFLYVEGEDLNPDALPPTSEQGSDRVAPRNEERRQESTIENNKININEATEEELMTLQGIGRVRAQDIINYRNQHGRFRTMEDIQNVRGIGTRTFENIRDFITVGE